MEKFGILIRYRGICDYGDKFKNDDWQKYTAIVAACYTKDLIENLPSF